MLSKLVRFPNPLDIGSDFSSQAGTLSNQNQKPLQESGGRWQLARHPKIADPTFSSSARHRPIRQEWRDADG